MSTTWGFVGGRDFGADGLITLLKSVPLTDGVVVGSGIGSEKFVREQAPELGLPVSVPPLRPDLFDFPRPGGIKVGTPPVADTRLLMLARLDQVMLYGEARAAENIGSKAKGALEAQVTDVVVACMGGKLVLMGGGRAKQAQAIVDRIEKIKPNDRALGTIHLTQRWEVIVL